MSKGSPFNSHHESSLLVKVNESIAFKCGSYFPQCCNQPIESSRIGLFKM